MPHFMADCGGKVKCCQIRPTGYHNLMSKLDFSALRQHHRLPDDQALAPLIKLATVDDATHNAIVARATAWVQAVRANKAMLGSVGDFLQEFSLSSQEGVALLCVAEALLRIPDTATQDALIADKLSAVEWANHQKRTGTLFAGSAVFGLMLTGQILQPDAGSLLTLTRRLGAPVIRVAVKKAMALLGSLFVLGQTIDEALDNGYKAEQRGYLLSYDMLGEGARTHEDAERYFISYQKAIAALADSEEPDTEAAITGDVWSRSGLSVKLSALHPRFHDSHKAHCLPVLIERMLLLCQQAAAAGLALTVDAEESERLELQIELMAALLEHPVTERWSGLAMAVQAYQKRAPEVIALMAHHCRTHHRRMGIRLVKGAYWDSEIKKAQMAGLPDYAVYTRKAATDVSYLACAKLLLEAGDVIYAAFGTHNAHTIASIMHMAGARRDLEFQRLQGMGEALHDAVLHAGFRSRIYAPVGGYQDLLAYLVRRILENGANSSFVQQVADPAVPIASLLHDPVAELATRLELRNPRIPLPTQLFAATGRKNSHGVDLEAEGIRTPFMQQVAHFAALDLPAWSQAGAAEIEQAFTQATAAQPSWAQLGVEARAVVLEHAADLIEKHMAEFVALIGLEAKRVVKNAVAEVREAVDLCRYYAQDARHSLAPQTLVGYTGERNVLSYAPRGVVVAISPWNFPLAIFVGQVAAALVAGNAVLAKPAEQTPVIATRAVELLHEAGVPKEVLHLLCGTGETVGHKLVQDARTSAVVFTGSTEVGQIINRTLAAQSGPLVPLVAETGGLNVMIVDSTALPEQVVDDVLLSAFDSAGQRCSSLRVLCVQEDVAERIIDLLKGAMDCLRLGDPLASDTDIGPLIDAEAKAALDAHMARMKSEGNVLHQVSAPVAGDFMPPALVEIASLRQLQREAFGPVLHLVRWSRDKLADLLVDIKASGYGLTCGIHSRRSDFVDNLTKELAVGNLYVNRNMIGAIPGVQPFGGEKLSGTGPKAGGPHYVRRFTVERCLSVDTTAAGGNTSLLMQQGE